MGRWAQRNRRGGGGVAGGPTATLFISSITWVDNNTLTLVFSAPATTDDGAAMGGLTVNGLPVASVETLDPTTVTLHFTEQVNVDDAWALASQPPWVETLMIIPESGVVLA